MRTKLNIGVRREEPTPGPSEERSRDATPSRDAALTPYRYLRYARQ